MKRIALLVLCMVAYLAAWSESTIAAVFERDWKAPGDGLLTYDDVSQREWLDLSQSLLIRFPGSTLESRYQSVTAELVPGGLFEGFVPAESEDVIALAQSAGIDTTTLGFTTNETATFHLTRLLGTTLAFSGEHFYSQGFLNEFSPRFANRVISVYVVHQAPLFGRAGILFTDATDDFAAPSSTGVMLYREVPEAPSLVLVVACVPWLLSHVLRCRALRFD